MRAIFELISSILKYVFTILIYLFIFWIARLIYLDISVMQRGPSPAFSNQPYLKLINRRDQLGFKVEEIYNLREKNTIGRSPKNEIVLKDPYISSEHVRIWQSEGVYYLEDLGSKNGSMLNGLPVSGPVLLKNGDKISFGQLEFLFVTEQK